MLISYDPAKDEANRAKHHISLARAAELEWKTALVWDDERQDYGEARCCAIGYIGLRLHVVASVERDSVRRIISLRRANSREVRRYAEA